ncbi:acyl-homoserine-lactone synthase [Thalassovita taeanensis]|uniref:Acyl-homoserine-lactone synthase n=1 Tax=Thalassovita taeanensis TaxID=657014 RepID=A0A1H9HRQ6_9RHOB|nr:acyl-homoserine-lactone synthase [Thalassovita taeanensis]SEQ65001.1 N-acyl-L-homoserine lactone synthetase [Thalassovita taeanensis]
MIIVVDALNREKFADVLTEMFQLRARVFGGRLGWEVDITNGLEIDQFDRLDPAYFICLDDDGHVVGCVRALQTTGPHMLSDVFQSILNGEPPLRSSTLWESTRFCVDTKRLSREDATSTISQVTCEVMIGSLQWAQNAGITDIVTVIDPVMNRVLKRSGAAPYGYVGATVPMGKVKAMAALLDCTDERINEIRNYAGISHDVFADEDEALALFNARVDRETGVPARSALPATDAPVAAPAPTEAYRSDHLRSYCEEQIANASTPEEYAAAVALKRELADLLKGAAPRRLDA